MGSRLRILLTSPWRAFQWLMVARPIRFTRFGLFYVLFAIAIGAAAINTGNNLLYLILGILLGFIIVSGFLSDSCLWGLRSEWSLPGSLYANSSVPGECRLRKGWFPAVLVTITATWKGAVPSKHLIYWLGGGREQLFRFHLTPTRRGWLALESVHVSTLFPFGLFQKFHSYSRDERWLVYPRLQAVNAEALLSEGKELSEGLRRRGGIGEIPYLLRDYRSGDSARRIHWKTSARRQRLIVKEMEEQTAPARWLAIPHWPTGLTEAEQEDLLSFAASLVNALYKGGQRAGFAAPDIHLEPADSQEPIYRYLALLDARLTSTVAALPHSYMDIVSLWRQSHEA